MKNIGKRILALGLGVAFLTSCGGHSLCDAYGFMEYKKEAKEKRAYELKMDENDDSHEILNKS